MPPKKKKEFEDEDNLGREIPPFENDDGEGLSDDPNDQVPDVEEHDENPFVAGFEMFKPKKKKTQKEIQKEEKENLVRAAEALERAKAGVSMLQELAAAKTPYSEYPEKAKWLVNRMGHLVFVIQNGELKSEGAAELRKGNYYYRVRSTIDGVDVVDYDKNRVKPFVKDILNRAGEFMEIKMLWWILYALALMQLTSMFGCARAGNS